MQGKCIVCSILIICCFPHCVLAIEPSLSPDTMQPIESTTQLAQQPTPNQNPLPNPESLPPDQTVPILPQVPERSPSSPAQPELLLTPSPEPSIVIRDIDVRGSSVLQSEINRIKEKFRGQTISLGQVESKLQDIADAITQAYLDQGYLNSRAIPDDTNLNDDVLTIRVIEGRLDAINIRWIHDQSQQSNEATTSHRLRESYIRQRIRRGAGFPLRIEQLENQLRLLRADTALFESVEATLVASGEPGKSNLIVTLNEADPFQYGLSFDNYSSPSVGSERAGIDLSDSNLTGNGDSLSGSYFRSTSGGSNVLGFNYQIPVNSLDGAIQLRAGFDFTRVTQSNFADFNIQGESQTYELSFRQPVVRSPQEEFILSLSFGFKNGQTFLFDRPTPFGIGPDSNGISRTSVFRFAQDYIHRDNQGAWVGRSQFSMGTGLLNATVNEDPIPDSRFFSWLGQFQRVQRLGTNHLLILQADLQLTPDTLLPSEQFVIGGGQSLRGYRQNIRSGDSGFRTSIEDRIALDTNTDGNPILQLIPFIDLGSVWNVSDDPNILPNQTFLAGTGLGLLWEALPGLNLQVEYALPLIQLEDRSDNLQDDSIYFSVNYRP
jgi:hemolysin activation/secretion protein